MNTLSISRIGTIIFALIIGFFGVTHFINASTMGGIVPGYLPGGGKIWVYFTGACMILAAIAFITNKYAKPAGLLLAAMLLLFVIMLHIPALINADSNTERIEPMTNLLKDTAMAACALIIAGRSK
jgi:putative oxidoreductase